MEVDIATLGIKVDASTADTAATDLNKLTNAADKAETATKGAASGSDAMRAAISAAIGAINANTSAVTQLTNKTNSYRTAATGAGAATDDMESRVDRLRSSVDPLSMAIDRVNAELMENSALLSAGAISQAEYARGQTVLNQRLADFQRRQALATGAMGLGARSAKLQAHEVLNLSRQFADIGVTAAMGMNPLMILVQQGPQIADVLGTARARGISTADAFRQMGGSIMPWVTRLAGPLAAIGLAMGAVGLAARTLSKDLTDVQAEFGFTEKQMERLEEKGTNLGYSMGDIMSGIGAVIAESLNFEDIEDAWNEMLDYLGEDAMNFIESAVGWFGGMVEAIKVFFADVPSSVGAVLIQVLNVVINNINDMVERGTRVINKLRAAVGNDPLTAFQIKNVENPLQSQMDNLSNAYDRGNQSARRTFRAGMASSRRERIREDAGDGDKPRAARKPKQSDEEKDWEKAVKGAEAYTKALREQTEEIGKNIFEVKRLKTERETAELMAAAGALGTVEAMEKAVNLSLQMRDATEAWIAATNAQKIKEMKLALEDEAKALEFEQSLVSMNNAERLKAIKLREINIRIMEAERDGYYGVAEALRAEAEAVANAEGQKGARLDKLEDAKRATEVMREMNDSIREATESFGELFGTAGEGFANLLDTILDFNEQRAESEERLAEIQSKYAEGQRMSQADAEEMGRIQARMAQDQVAHYGNMLSAAKTFFKEGSTGWKVLETAERLYRLFQFAMAIRAMFMDKAQTASSVANSGARAAADGVAAVAKAIASLPFPLNLVAGAATLAFLVGIGVKMFGGGGGKGGGGGASSSAEKAMDVYKGPRDEFGAPTSYYSVLKPGATVAESMGASSFGQTATNNVVVQGGSISVTVQGNMVEDTVQELIPVLEQYKTQAVNDARAAVSQDIQNAQTRQQIGG